MINGYRKKLMNNLSIAYFNSFHVRNATLPVANYVTVVKRDISNPLYRDIRI